MASESVLSNFKINPDEPTSVDSHAKFGEKSDTSGGGSLSSFSINPPGGEAVAQPEKPKKQLEPTSLSDVAKSVGSGIEVGAAQLAGLPGDLASAARWLKEEGKYYGQKGLEHYGYLPEGTADTDWKEVEKARQDPNRGLVGGILPTSSVTEKFAKENIPGANYEPKSVGGEYGHTIGEVVPALLGGEGSIAKKLGTAVISGGASEAAGQATEGTPYEGVARLGGMLAAPFAAQKLSRPLGFVGSALGVGDEALGAAGLKSGSMVARDKLVSEVSRLKQLGILKDVPEQNIKAVLEQEAADNVHPSNSVISGLAAISDSPTDVINAFIKNSSLNNPKVRAGVQEAFGNTGKAAEVADMTATRILDNMQDEASLNALNAHRIANGLPADLTEAPTADKIRSVANEVKQGAWERLVQPTLDDHQAVRSDILSDALSSTNNRKSLGFLDVFDKTANDYNAKLDALGKSPIRFLKGPDGSYKDMGYVSNQGAVKGAPLDFLERLRGNLYETNDDANKIIAEKIKNGVNQYFSNKGLPNELQIAKKNYGDIRSQDSIINAGMNFIKDGTYQTNPAKRQAFLSRWNRLDDTEKGLYQTGVLHQIQSTLSQGTQGYKGWNKILSNQDNRALLQEIMNFRPQGAAPVTGATNFEKFNSALDVAQMFKKEHVNNVLANTPETRTFLGKVFGIGNVSLPEVMLHTAYRGAFSPELGAITAISGGLGWIRQVYNDRQALNMLKMFNSKDPNAALQLARDIANHKEAKTSWQKVKSLLDFTDKATLNFYRRAVMAQAASQPQGHKKGGRVGFGPGGEVDVPDDAPQFPNRKVNELGFYSKAGEALRGFPNADKQQEIAKILKTLYDKHDVHPDEMRYTGVTTPESSRNNIQLSDTFGGVGEMSPSDLAEHVEKQQPQMMRKRLGVFGVPGKTQYDSYAMSNPHLKDYTEDVYHFPERQMDKSLEWQANPTKWTVHRDEHDKANVHDENGDYVSYVNQKFSDDDAIRMIHDEFANYKENQTKSGLNFTEPHFSGTENLNKSGWMRHNVATFPSTVEVPNGAKFKNIEELQPQRAQQAEKLGLNSEPYNPNKEDELKARWMEANAAEAKATTAEERKAHGEKASGLKKQYLEYQRKHRNAYGQVADAPYANSVEASTKRYARQMLSDAVKEGMDGVSITPWYRNAERAGARPIDQIELTRSADGKNSISVRGNNHFDKVGLFPHHDNLSEENINKLHSLFGKQITKKILTAMKGASEQQSDVVMTPTDEEDPFMYSPSENGQVIDGNRYFYKDYLPRVLEKEARQIDPNIKVQGLFRLSDPKGRFGDKMGTHHGVAFSKKFINAAKAGGFRSFKQGGEVERPKRSTGGRIPEVDKLFKAAKRELDSQTKPMLNVHDDAIVNALRIAQGRV